MKALIEDTRQKAEKHKTKHKYFAAEGIGVTRCALPYGDYAPPPKVAVDTKEGIAEIAYNMCSSSKEKTRFKNECIKAKEDGCKLIFLIEDTKFSQISDLYGTKVHLYSGQTVPGNQLALAMHIMSERYGCEYLFCRPEDAGRKIMELLNETERMDKDL